MDFNSYVFLTSIFTILIAIIISSRIKNIEVKQKNIRKISEIIHNGAKTFLKREYSILIPFVFIISAIIYLTLDNPATALNEGAFIALSFVFGSFLSILSGYFGMIVSTLSNSRTTSAAKKNIHSAMRIAFSSGLVMGSLVVGFGLLGISVMVYLYHHVLKFTLSEFTKIIIGFGFGASSSALFARVGGGIFTKAADIGSDLVGKFERNLPEDDYRNPAVIADNVGDNVGDVAGMGADLFESYVGSIIATMIIAAITFDSYALLLLPCLVGAIGALSSFIGSLFVRLKKSSSISSIFRTALFLSSFFMIIFSFMLLKYVFATELMVHNILYMNIFYTIIIGLVLGLLLGLITEYYTSYSFKPVQKICNASTISFSSTILEGLSLGYVSTFLPILFISIAIYYVYNLSGLFGIALASVGLLSTLNISLAVDCFGPVVDNAQGIAQMTNQSFKVKKITNELDSIGNTTAAIGKGFAIASAALTALALFSAYSQSTNLSIINLVDYKVLIGLLIGGLLPFVFTSFTLEAVSNAASDMIKEIRTQLKHKKKKPDYDKAIDISTQAALRELALPSIVAILSPFAIGLLLGKEALAGLLAGSLVTGILLAISMSTSGSAWDNAKKYIELGNYNTKNSRKAAILGDTIGDPLKDCCAPSLNILIKLMAMTSLLFVVLIL